MIERKNEEHEEKMKKFEVLLFSLLPVDDNRSISNGNSKNTVILAPLYKTSNFINALKSNTEISTTHAG